MASCKKCIPRCRHLLSLNALLLLQEVVINKIKQMVYDLVNIRIEVELGVRINLASELKKLRDKIVVSGPYTERRYIGVPPLSFI